MRKMKKLASMMLALVMVLAMGVTALADTTYTITVTSEKSGHTYEAYQIFSGDLVEETDATTGVVTKTILSNIEWGTGIDGEAFLTALTSDSTLGSVFGNCTSAADVAEKLAEYEDDSTTVQAFAQLASSYLSTSATGTSTGGTTADADGKYTYTISGLSAGYYLVKDKDNSVTAAGDAYTDIILEVVTNVTVEAKAEYPSVTKEVSDEDASIGDTVTYTLTGTVPDTSAYTSYTYVFNDTLSSGLTYVTGSLKVTVDGETLTENTDYTLTVSDYDSTSGTTITITMLNAKSLSNKSIVVTYDATLNSNAIVGNEGNDNKVNVTYSNNPNGSGTGTTPDDEVVTFTFELDVTKVDGDDDQTKLEGAEFVLYKEVNGTTYYVVIDSNNKVTGWTTHLSAEEGDAEDTVYASVLTSDEDGNFSVIGLDTGTYYLKETKAPDGYNLLSDPVTLVITATYNDTDTDGVDEVSSLTVKVGTGDATESTDEDKSSVDVTVENNAGSTLPSTGGIGTTLFYIVGTILVLGAAVLLITRRRMSKAE